MCFHSPFIECAIALCNPEKVNLFQITYKHYITHKTLSYCIHHHQQNPPQNHSIKPKTISLTSTKRLLLPKTVFS